MISLVHIHIGETLPRYFWDTVKQSRRFFPGPIYLVLSEHLKVERKTVELDVITIPFESLTHQVDIAALKRYSFIQDQGEFWYRTLLRLFILEALMHEVRISHVVHLENDVAIYIDPSVHEHALSRIFHRKVAVNPVGPGHATAAYLYADDAEVMTYLNHQQLSLLSRGEDYIKSILGSDSVNEMVLLKILADRFPERIGLLPPLPASDGFEGVEDFHSLFDGASWGQFVGGTPENPLPGVAFEHHWVGHELIKGRYGVEWNADEHGRMCPWVVNLDCDSDGWPLNNLHIHSKQVKKFTRTYPFAWLNSMLYKRVQPNGRICRKC